MKLLKIIILFAPIFLLTNEAICEEKITKEAIYDYFRVVERAMKENNLKLLMQTVSEDFFFKREVPENPRYNMKLKGKSQYELMMKDYYDNNIPATRYEYKDIVITMLEDGKTAEVSGKINLTINSYGLPLDQTIRFHESLTLDKGTVKISWYYDTLLFK